jgi:hypothetical protein
MLDGTHEAIEAVLMPQIDPLDVLKAHSQVGNLEIRNFAIVEPDRDEIDGSGRPLPERRERESELVLHIADLPDGSTG